jgi:hypothetical protein
MDFSKPITIATSTSASLDLNSITAAPVAGTPMSGYMVDSVSYAGTPITGFIDPLAQRDGAEADIALLSPRAVQIVCQVYGSSQADFYDKLNAINSAFAPYPTFAAAVDGFRNLDFNQPTSAYGAYAATGIPMRLKVRPVALPSYGLRMANVTPQTTDRGLAASVNITLACKDPRKISQTSITGTLASSTTLTNNGNYNAYPTFTLVATAAQTATISTSSWTVSVTIASGTTTTVIDGENRKVTVGGTLNMTKLHTTTTQMPIIYSGANVVTLSSTASLATITATYSYAEAWL